MSSLWNKLKDISRRQPTHGDDRAGGRSAGGSRSSSTGRVEPPSMLTTETDEMEQRRRSQEKQGLRALIKAKVQEREASVLSNQTEGPEAGYDVGSELEQHPLLQGQQFDGIDNNPSDPSLSPWAKDKIKEVKRKQELEKQLRLENRLELQMSNKPRHSQKFMPRPGGP